MKVKRYVVSDMAEAIKAIREDLGPDAVIIHTRKIRQKGWLKFFKPRKLEVTAAVDEKIPQKAEVIRDDQEDSKIQPVKQEIAEVKAILKEFIEKDVKSSPLGAVQEKLFKELVEKEIQEDIAKALILATSERTPEGVEAQEDYLKLALKSEIKEKLEPLYQTRGFGERIVAFVGPTGVGKTTTLAKLAAQYTLFHKKKIALVTIDTYRIGAVEQLKTYGEIIGVPVDVVMTPNELKSTIERHSDKEYIFIDTAGRSSKNTMQVLELKGFLDAIGSVETFLVLSSTTKLRDIDRIVEDFITVGFNKIIFTKIDETNALGCIVNTIFKTNVPVAYITDGQNVPDDIQNLYPKKIAKMVLKGVEHQ